MQFLLFYLVIKATFAVKKVLFGIFLSSSTNILFRTGMEEVGGKVKRESVAYDQDSQCGNVFFKKGT